MCMYMTIKRKDIGKKRTLMHTSETSFIPNRTTLKSVFMKLVREQVSEGFQAALCPRKVIARSFLTTS